MFLRNGCALPDKFRLKQEPFNAGWMSANDITAASLDAGIRRAGWQFLWLHNVSSGFGYARNAPAAIAQAIGRALRRTSGRFNAGEVVSIRVSRCAGFHLARVAVHARHIQQQGALGALDPAIARQPRLG